MPANMDRTGTPRKRDVFQIELFYTDAVEVPSRIWNCLGSMDDNNMGPSRKAHQGIIIRVHHQASPVLLMTPKAPRAVCSYLPSIHLTCATLQLDSNSEVRKIAAREITRPDVFIAWLCWGVGRSDGVVPRIHP
jgi:hypothetical protein